MNRLERLDSDEEAMQAAFRGLLAELWTALPGIVQSFDPVTMTVVVQPAIQSQRRAPDGTQAPVSLPLLDGVPVVFLGGGDFTTTYPIREGDECLVTFASRCIDDWWLRGGVQAQSEFRMHDLSDAFAFVGARSRPRALPDVSTTATQIRSNDGQTYIELGANGAVRIQATTIEMHAREKISWDVNGFGKSVEYTDENEWTVHTWQTPVLPQIVITEGGNINPPEGP